MQKSAIARDAYVQAEVSTFVAHQIRAIRQQRGLSQQELATRLKTTQTAVSRMEDPSYGRLSLKTLMDLARVFDTGLQVKFVSFLTMLQTTYFAKRSTREVPSFEEESQDVDFFENSSGAYPLSLSGPSGMSQVAINVVTPFRDLGLAQSTPVFSYAKSSTVSIAFMEEIK